MTPMTFSRSRVPWSTTGSDGHRNLVNSIGPERLTGYEPNLTQILPRSSVHGLIEFSRSRSQCQGHSFLWRHTEQRFSIEDHLVECKPIVRHFATCVNLPLHVLMSRFYGYVCRFPWTAVVSVVCYSVNMTFNI